MPCGNTLKMLHVLRLVNTKNWQQFFQKYIAKMVWSCLLKEKVDIGVIRGFHVSLYASMIVNRLAYLPSKRQ